MEAFAAAIDALFADPNIARDATWTPAGGGPVSVRAVVRAPDAVVEFGAARVASATLVAEVRTADVPDPAPGDVLTVDGADHLIQGEPQRDALRLVWMLNLRPA